MDKLKGDAHTGTLCFPRLHKYAQNTVQSPSQYTLKQAVYVKGVWFQQGNAEAKSAVTSNLVRRALQNVSQSYSQS